MMNISVYIFLYIFKFKGDFFSTLIPSNQFFNVQTIWILHSFIFANKDGHNLHLQAETSS